MEIRLCKSEGNARRERGGETEIRIIYAFSKLNESKGGPANMTISWQKNSKLTSASMTDSRKGPSSPTTNAQCASMLHKALLAGVTIA